jgi:hypothetical protein
MNTIDQILSKKKNWWMEIRIENIVGIHNQTVKNSKKALTIAFFSPK